MRETARAFWVTAPGRGEIQDVTLASPREHEILVRTEFSGISRGTEALVFTGRVPRSEWQANGGELIRTEYLQAMAAS